MKNSSGFTLIELILVTVIIGILAGMVVTTYGGRVRETQIRRSKADIVLYSNAIDLYALDHNDEYPRALEDLVTGDRNYVRQIENDPWGNPYNYTPATDARKSNYEVWSSGPDGSSGTEDDVTLQTEL